MSGRAREAKLRPSAAKRVGLLPFVVIAGQPLFLAFKTRKAMERKGTSGWEILTDDLQAGEPVLTQAARLGRQAIGLDPLAPGARLQAPFLLSGAPCVLLCPCRLSGERSWEVQVSRRYESHAWVDLDELCRLLGDCAQTDQVRTVLNEVVRCVRAVASASRHRRNIIAALSVAIEEKVASLGFSWYLAGSLAAGEHTVLGDRLLSDLDLVAIGRIPSPRRRAEVRRRLADRLTQVSPDWSSKLSIYFLDPADTVHRCEPFWSYFARHCSGLTDTAGRHTLRWRGRLTPSAGTMAYQAFRLIWYAALPGFAVDIEKESYRSVKGEVMASILAELWDGRSFHGYGLHRERLLRSAVAASGDTATPALAALDVKMNLRPLPHVQPKCGPAGAWAGDLLRRVRGSSPALAMSQAVLLLQEDAFTMPHELAELVGRLLGPKTLSLWNHALERCHREVVWLLLVGLRLTLWPREVRFSHYRYAGLISQLDAQAMLHPCCAGRVHRSEWSSTAVCGDRSCRQQSRAVSDETDCLHPMRR